MRKKHFLNFLLIIIVLIIYRAILTDAREIFFRKPLRVTKTVQEKRMVKKTKLPSPKLSAHRNYFRPGSRPASRKTPKIKPETSPADTLAVLHDGIRNRYLLKKGDRIWIQ